MNMTFGLHTDRLQGVDPAARLLRWCIRGTHSGTPSDLKLSLQWGRFKLGKHAKFYILFVVRGKVCKLRSRAIKRHYGLNLVALTVYGGVYSPASFGDGRFLDCLVLHWSDISRSPSQAILLQLLEGVGDFRHDHNVYA